MTASDSTHSITVSIYTRHRRCKHWAKLIPAGAELPLPQDAGGPSLLPGDYLQGEVTLRPGDMLIEGEQVHHVKARGWSYWATVVSAKGKKIVLRYSADVRDALRQMGLRKELLAGSGQRVVKAQANRLLRKMQVAVRDKAKARQLDRKRLLAFGAAVIKAGCGQWAPEEVGGALMDVRERIGDSVTMRLGFRKRAEATSPRKRGSVRSTPARVAAGATDAQQPQPPERIAAHAAEP